MFSICNFCCYQFLFSLIHLICFSKLSSLIESAILYLLIFQYLKKNPPMKNPPVNNPPVHNPPNKNPPPAKKLPKFREPDSAEVKRSASTTTKKPADPAIVRRRPGIPTMTSQISCNWGGCLILHKKP